MPMGYGVMSGISSREVLERFRLSARVQSVEFSGTGGWPRTYAAEHRKTGAQMSPQDSSWIRRMMTVGSFADLKEEIVRASAGLGFENYVLRARFPNLRTGFNEIS